MRKLLVPALVAFACCFDTVTSQAVIHVNFPAYIVGNSSGTPVPHQRNDGTFPGFKVTVTNQFGSPVVGALVELDFAPAVANGTLSLYSSQPSGQTFYCSNFRAEKYTDSNGDATLNVEFGGQSGTTQSTLVRLLVGAGFDVYEAKIPAVSTDIDQDGRTGLSDYANFVTAYLGPGYYFDCDYDHDGVTTSDLSDFSIFSESFLHSCTCSLCPR